MPCELNFSILISESLYNNQELTCVILSSLGEEGEETFYTNYDEVCDSFDAMELQPDLLRGIYAYGK